MYGSGKTVDEVCETLRCEIKKLNASTVTTLGSSAGGFASLLFGNMLQSECILAFSPQTFLDVKKCQEFGDTRWMQYKKTLDCDVKDTRYFNLSTLPKPLKTQMIGVVWGIRDQQDGNHIQYLKKHWEQIRVTECDDGHVVVRKLRDNGTLLRLLNMHIIR